MFSNITPCPSCVIQIFFFFLFNSSSQRQSQKSNKLQVGRLVWTLFLVRLFFILITWLFNVFYHICHTWFHSSSSKVWRSDKGEKRKSSQKRKFVQKLEKQTREKVSLWEVLGKAGSGKLKTARQIPDFPWENPEKTASLSLQTPTQPGQGNRMQQCLGNRYRPVPKYEHNLIAPIFSCGEAVKGSWNFKERVPRRPRVKWEGHSMRGPDN